jgi:hypothetical protein
MYCSLFGIGYFMGVTKSINPNKLDNLLEINSKAFAKYLMGLGITILGINIFLFSRSFNNVFCGIIYLNFKPNKYLSCFTKI